MEVYILFGVIILGCIISLLKNKKPNVNTNSIKNVDTIYYKDLEEKLKEEKSTDGWGVTFNVLIDLFGEERKAKLIIRTENEISDKQRETYYKFIEKWNKNFQTQIIEKVIKYYNEDEKFAYGPDDEEELKEWFPDINTVDEMIKQLELQEIIIPEDFLTKNERWIYLTFNHKWGHDINDNGIGIKFVNEEINEIGFKSIAY